MHESTTTHPMSHYVLAKLAALNYRMAIHEGDANRRLASEIDQIINLGVHKAAIPVAYRDEFTKLEELASKSSIAAQQMGKGLRPVKLGAIQNRTAAKYIKLLVDIENKLSD